LKLADWARKNGLDYKTAYPSLEGRRFRKRLNRWPYRMAQVMVDYKSPKATLYPTPRGTSSRCPVCGGKIEHPTRIPSDIRRKVSVCPTCGADYDSDRLASLAIACRRGRAPFADDHSP